MEIKVNYKILKICRQQMALTVEEAQEKAKLKTLHKIETGERLPTVKQIEELSKIYLVPKWIFFVTAHTSKKAKSRRWPLVINGKINLPFGNFSIGRSAFQRAIDDIT